MKTKYLKMIALLLSICCLVACTTKSQQQNQEECNDTISIAYENKDLDKEKIISLIKEDEERRNLWSYDIKASSSSPLFYEAISDEGLHLYRVAIQDQQTVVIIIEDDNIGISEDFIDIDGTDGVGYEHQGYYEIIDESIVNVFFEKRWSNYCHTCDSSAQEFTYNIKCTHGYKFLNMAFERINADTIVMIDERALFCCKDSLMRLLGLL